MTDLKVLIAVGESAEDLAQLPAGVQLLIDSADELFVVSPRLPGRFEWLSSATDKAEEEADQRLGKVLGQLKEVGSAPDGEVGADDPLLAFDDAFARFSATHILVGLRQEGDSGWQEEGLLEALRKRFPVPITVFGLGS